MARTKMNEGLSQHGSYQKCKVELAGIDHLLSGISNRICSFLFAYCSQGEEVSIATKLEYTKFEDITMTKKLLEITLQMKFVKCYIIRGYVFIIKLIV